MWEEPDKFSEEPDKFSEEPDKFSEEPDKFSEEPENLSEEPENLSEEPEELEYEPLSDDDSRQFENFSWDGEINSDFSCTPYVTPRLYQYAPQNVSRAESIP